MLAVYYCLLVLDRANDQKFNPNGIDIRPLIAATYRDMATQKGLAHQKEYLADLDHFSPQVPDVNAGLVILKFVSGGLTADICRESGVADSALSVRIVTFGEVIYGDILNPRLSIARWTIDTPPSLSIARWLFGCVCQFGDLHPGFTLH